MPHRAPPRVLTRSAAPPGRPSTGSGRSRAESRGRGGGEARAGGLARRSLACPERSRRGAGGLLCLAACLVLAARNGASAGEATPTPAPAPAREEVKVLTSFETRDDLGPWRGSRARELSIEHATHGRHSLFWTPPGAVGISSREECTISTRSASLLGWGGGGHEELRLDAFNDSGRIVLLALRVRDTESTPTAPASRLSRVFALRPGRNLISLNLLDLRTGDGSRRLAPANIVSLEIELLSSSRARLYLDNLRLVRPSAWAPREASRARLRLDFGSRNSPRFPGFLRVSPRGLPGTGGSRLLELRGAGMVAGGAGESERAALLDRLTSDWLLAPPRRAAVLHLSVPDGRYQALFVLRPFRQVGAPSRLTCGRTVGFRLAGTAEELLSAEGLFAPAAAAPGPAQLEPREIWRRYVLGGEHRVKMSVAASGGTGLDFSLENVAVAALLLFPAGEASRLRAETEALDRERREFFLANRYYEERPSGSSAGQFPPPSKEERLNGCYFFRLRPEEDAPPWYAPPDDQLVDGVKVKGRTRRWKSFRARGARGETVWVVIGMRPFRPLKGLKISIPELVCGVTKRKLPADAVKIFLSVARPREVLPGVFRFRAALLVPAEKPIDLPADATYTVWVRIRVPEDDKGREYRGLVLLETADGKGMKLRLVLDVWPFALSPLGERFRCGWFFRDPALANHCFGAFPGSKKLQREEIGREISGLAARGFNTVTFPAPGIRSISPRGEAVLDLAAVEQLLGVCREMKFAVDGENPMLVEAFARELADKWGMRLGSDAFRQAYVSAVRRTFEWAKRNKLRLFLVVADDPSDFSGGLPGRPTPEEAAKLVALARAASPQVRIGIFLSADELRNRRGGTTSTLRFLDLVDSVLTGPWSSSRRLASRATRGGRLWIAAGGMNRFSFGFQPYSLAASGRLQRTYQDAGLFDDALTSLSRPSAVFPSPRGPVSTIGYERAAAGLDDLRYLLTLEAVQDEARKKGKMDDVSRIEKILERVREAARGKRIEEPSVAYVSPDGRPPAWWDGPSGVSGEDLDEWRLLVASEIARLSRPLPAVPVPTRPPAPPVAPQGFWEEDIVELLLFRIPVAILVAVAGIFLIRLMRRRKKGSS